MEVSPTAHRTGTQPFTPVALSNMRPHAGILLTLHGPIGKLRSLACCVLFSFLLRAVVLAHAMPARSFSVFPPVRGRSRTS